MVVIEKSFPRGGTLKKIAPSIKKESVIFGGVNKKFKKLKKIKKVDLKENEADSPFESNSAEILKYDTIQEGMLVMGVVKNVDPLYLEVLLPGGLKARVSALDISNAYTQATQDYLANKQGLDSYKPLDELYKVNQMVYGIVKEITKKSERNLIKFSLKPNEVHAHLLHKNIRKGFVFNGGISEIQEHGLIIETGVKGLRAFLPQNKASPNHIVGELIYLKVNNITHDKDASTCSCTEIQINDLRVKSTDYLDNILPTSIVKVTNEKCI